MQAMLVVFCFADGIGGHRILDHAEVVERGEFLRDVIQKFVQVLEVVFVDAERRHIEHEWELLQRMDEIIVQDQCSQVLESLHVFQILELVERQVKVLNLAWPIYEHLVNRFQVFVGELQLFHSAPDSVVQFQPVTLDLL